MSDERVERTKPQLKLVVSNPHPITSSLATSVYIDMVLEMRRDREAEESDEQRGLAQFAAYEAEGRRGHANPIVRAKAGSAMLRDCRIAEKGGKAPNRTFDDYLDDAYAECIALRSFGRLVDVTNAQRAKSGRPPLPL
jgi:hypothetical protein